MVETEIKLRVPDAAATLAMLRKAKFRVIHRRAFEANEVLDTSDTVLRQNGRLLRLRETAGKVILTFKGPARPGRHKVRPEYEMELSDYPTAVTIFAELGYRKTFRYEKYRTELRRTNETGLAMLDETPIGTFLELEGPAKWIDSTAHELGFNRKDYVTSSYGALYFEDCERRGIPPKNMVFH